MWVGVDATIVPAHAGGRVGWANHVGGMPAVAADVHGQGAVATNVAGAVSQAGAATQVGARAPTSAAVGEGAHDDGGAAVSLISLVAGGDQGGLDADVHVHCIIIRFGGGAEFSHSGSGVTSEGREGTTPFNFSEGGREGKLCLWWEGLLAAGGATRLALAALGHHDEATEESVEGRGGIRVAFHICSGLRLQMPVGL
eukprot:49985-Prorocentrum_minimum.AAC.1